MVEPPTRVHTKRRASQACNVCRARKVRCDLGSTGIPCGNCRRDEVDCTITQSRRSRQYRQSKRKTPYDAVLDQQNSSSSTSRATAWECGSQTHQPPTSDTASNGLSNDASPNNPPSQSLSLPPYIQPNRTKIAEGDLRFLATRGALSIPEPNLRNELLLAFLLYVYPYMPVINVQSLLDSVYQQKDAQQYSLLLFQAMMFAGSAYIDMRSLTMLGFDSRRAARKAFHAKVKLLYDFGWEKDRLAIVQAMLISTYWYETPEDQQDPWHAIGLCLSVGNSIGLGDNAQHVRLPIETRRIWRRTWWSVILRDRVLVLTTRKPLHIREEDVTIPLLNLQDFEVDPISSTVAALLGSTIFCDAGIRATLARLCIEKVKLSLFSARTMVQTYKLTSHSIEPTDFVMLYTARRDRSALAEAIRIHHDIEQWQHSLPADCEYHAHSLRNLEDDRSVMVQRAILRQFFTIIHGLLYRPFLKTKLETPSLETFLTEVVRPALRDMMNEVSDMATILVTRDVVQFMIPMSVTYFLGILFTVIIEIQHSRHELRDQMENQFRQCNQALIRMRDIYHIADAACTFIEYLISKGPNPSTSTSAAFLESEQSQGANPVHTDSPRSLDQSEPNGNGGNINVTENIYDHTDGIYEPATDAQETTLWSDFAPWFYENDNPLGGLLWKDLHLADYTYDGIIDSTGFVI